MRPLSQHVKCVGLSITASCIIHIVVQPRSGFVRWCCGFLKLLQQTANIAAFEKKSRWVRVDGDTAVFSIVFKCAFSAINSRFSHASQQNSGEMSSLSSEGFIQRFTQPCVTQRQTYTCKSPEYDKDVIRLWFVYSHWSFPFSEPSPFMSMSVAQTESWLIGGTSTWHCDAFLPE